MEAHADFGRLTTFVWFDEDIRAGAFHCAGKIHFQLRIVSGLEGWDTQHRHSVIRSYSYRSNLLAHGIRYRNDIQSCGYAASEKDPRVRIIRRQVVFGRSEQHELR